MQSQELTSQQLLRKFHREQVRVIIYLSTLPALFVLVLLLQMSAAEWSYLAFAGTLFVLFVSVRNRHWLVWPALASVFLVLFWNAPRWDWPMSLLVSVGALVLAGLMNRN